MITNKTWHTGIISLLLAVSILATSCGFDAGPYFGNVEPPNGQVLRYLNGTEPETLDPQMMTGAPEAHVAVALFDGLVEFDEATVKPRNSLAESYEPSAEGTTWTFHLRRLAKWSDGTNLTAHDLVYSWRRVVTPALGSRNAGLMYLVKYARPFNQKLAFLRDPVTSKYATAADLTRARADGRVEFTGAEPERYYDPVLDRPATGAAQLPVVDGPTPADASELITVPAGAAERDRLINGDPQKQKPAQPDLARLIAGKEIVPVTQEHVAVRALDEFTFVVTLANPTASFVKRLMHPAFRPVPRQAIARHGDVRWTKPENIVTSGAFRLAEWSPYERIVVARNTAYWDNANTKLDQIEFIQLAQQSTAMNLYKTGQADCMQTSTIPPSWRRVLQATKKDYRSGPQLKVEGIAFNTTLPIFRDERVRQALSLAIDRDIIADQAPGRVPTTSIVPPMDGYRNAQVGGYDPNSARRLLAEAGFPNGQGFPPLEYLYNNVDSLKQTAELCQQMWKRELNISITLVNVEMRVFLNRTRADRMEFNGMARMAQVANYADPFPFLEMAFSGSPDNATGWHDPGFDRLMEASTTETNELRRAGVLHDAEQYMLDHSPLIPLYFEPNAFMCKPYVVNLMPNLLDMHDWRGVYIDHNVTATSLGL